MTDYFTQRLNRLEREAVRAIGIFMVIAIISILLLFIYDNNQYVVYLTYGFVSFGLFYTTYKVYYYDIEKEMFENRVSDEILMSEHLKRDAKETIFKNIAIFLGYFFSLLGLDIIAFVAMSKRLQLFNPPLSENIKICILAFGMFALVIIFQYLFGKKMRKALYEAVINFKYLRGIDKNKDENNNEEAK